MSMDSLFGPFTKNYCFYFNYLSMFGLIVFVLIILSTLFLGISMKKQNLGFYLTGFLTALTYLIFGYFQNRLLYTMCVHSI